MSLLAITGGAGRIGTELRPLLREHYQLRLLDLREPPTSPTDGEEFQQLDMADLGATERAFAGVDAVLHLAGQPNTRAPWSSVLKDNIEATRSVYEAARRQSVRRVVFASTNHVVGFYNLERDWPIDTRVAVRPDSLYGVSKAFGEALARYYTDAFDLSIICLRIGWFTNRPPSVPMLNPLWISTRDMAQIVELCLQTSRRFGIYNATSNNPHRHWDLQSARDELGYEPRDDVTTVATDTDAMAYVEPQAGVLADMDSSP